MIKWKRPRGIALLVVAGLVGTGLIASVAIAALVSDTGTYSVEVADKDHSSALVTLAPGGAKVEYIGSSANNQSSGTGIFDPFVRLQGGPPSEQGYNTNGAVQFDTKTGQWTHAILVSAIPVVDCDGDGSGTATCWELFVDINDANSTPHISLTDVEIYFADGPGAATLVNYPFTSPPAGTTVTQEYDFSGEIKINDVNQGSGRGDLRYLVPTAGHPFTSTTYFVLYSKWGSTDAAPGGDTYASDGGFEEWKVRKAPNVGIVKTANPVGPVNAGSNIGFDITVSNTGAAAASNVTITDNLPAGGGGLNWLLSPAFSGCSIIGPVGSQVLTCTFATLAAGDSIGPIHLTSPTTAADCGLVSNTATVVGDGSSTASVTVQCAAIRILKESTKSGNPLVTDAGNGALFTVTPTVGSAFTVRDNDDPSAGGKSDESSTFGEVCISGLAPGNYTVNETTPPSGYGAAGQANLTAVAANGTDCSGSKPTDGNSAVFTNAPLYDLQVNFRDGGSGETSATIACSPVDPPDSTNPPTGWGTSSTYTGRSAPQTVTCTITVDP